MGRERPPLGTPFGMDGPVLHALVTAVYDLHDLIDARLPPRDAEPTSEPVPARRPPRVVPVKEPAPDLPPDEDEEPEEARPALPPPPPRAGKGSGLDAWQAFANLAGVDYPADASRADIVAACESAGAIPAE